MNFDFIEATNKISTLLLELGKYAKSYQNNDLEIEDKSTLNFVTKIDIELNKKIVDFLKNNYPDHQILSEEDAAITNNSDYCWYVDPIDGTMSYILGLPFWSLMVGLSYKGEIILGIIYFPTTDELFIGHLKHPTTLNGKITNIRNISTINKSFASMCTFNQILGENADIYNNKIIALYEKLIFGKGKIFSFRACGYSLCSVAAGRMDYAIVVDNKPWDMVAPGAICKFAGVNLINFNGKDFNSSMTQCIAVTPSLIDNLKTNLNGFVW